MKPTNGPWILKLNYVVPAAVQPKEAPRVRFNKPIVRRRQLRQPQFGSGVEVSKSTETKIADLGTYDYWVVSSYTVTPKPDPDENAHGSAILGPLPRYEKRRILKKVADSDSDESDEKAHSVHGRCEVKAWKQYPILCRRLAAGKADSYSSVYDTDS